jgi:hypothetical protein
MSATGRRQLGQAGVLTRRFAVTVLAAEAVVLFFFALTASRLRPNDAALIAIVSALGATAALALCGLVRHRWALWVGGALQVALIAAGLVIPIMYVLGAIFAVLWFAALRLAARTEATAVTRGGR